MDHLVALLFLIRVASSFILNRLTERSGAERSGARDLAAIFTHYDFRKDPLG